MITDKKNRKKEQIYNTARHLFMKFGIRRVSVEEICREANVSKMTFYKYFPNKIELAKYVFKVMTDKAMQKYKDIVHSQISYNEKVERFVQLKIRESKDISSEFFHDIHQFDDPDLRSFIQNSIKQNIDIILDDFINAQKNGELRHDIKPEFILYFFNLILDIAKDERLVKMYDSPKELISEMTKFMFYGILPRP